MFKRKTKPAHVRANTHTHTTVYWLSRTHPVREKREVEGKNTKDSTHTHSLLSNDTQLEENLDKTRQSGENWSIWWFDIHAEQTEKQRLGQNWIQFQVFPSNSQTPTVIFILSLCDAYYSKHWMLHLLQMTFKKERPQKIAKATMNQSLQVLFV